MRYPASEKLEIIRTVETSHLPVRRTLDKIGIPKTTFYAWLDRYADGGLDALEDRKPRPKRVWNRIPQEVRGKLIERALDGPELSPWGWFYLSTVLDDFSRYIVAWKLCTTMSAADVTATLERALQASGLDQVEIDRRPWPAPRNDTRL